MSLFSKKTRKKIIAAVSAAVLIFCLVIELGQLVPSLGIPGWDELFANADLSGAPVTPEGELQVYFIDVGNADSILIRQGEVNALIDAGERGDGDDVFAYLNRQGVKKLDLVIATHPHADHIGGMADVIGGITIDKFVMSFMPEDETPTTATYLNMLTALDEKNVTVEEAKLGTEYALGTARLTVLGPLSESDEANNVSVVTRLTFGERSFLFMGDAETDVEQELLTSGRLLSADVIKVGHHGSNTSSSQAFLSKVDPDFAIVPCGKGNSYGHPHDEVLTRLDKMDVEVYRADVHGHIAIATDGKNLTISTQK